MRCVARPTACESRDEKFLDGRLSKMPATVVVVVVVVVEFVVVVVA